jgi:hypothetical protein
MFAEVIAKIIAEITAEIVGRMELNLNHGSSNL